MSVPPSALYIIILLSGALLPGKAGWAYEAELHQQLTFIAARQYNRCVQDGAAQVRLSALDTRYIVKANVAQADRNLFVRMFRWHYYNRQDQSDRSALWVIETRFHDRFNDLAQRLAQPRKRSRNLSNLGRIVNYVQDVTSPAHVVPVYAGRWWRFSPSDRFDRFPVDGERVEQMVADRCAPVMQPAAGYDQVLADAADDTLTAVQSPIRDFPTTWEAYWQLATEADKFGGYGRAGNQFGKRTEFRCGDGQRCLLLENDPLYREFALQRHVAAVVASMRAFRLAQ